MLDLSNSIVSALFTKLLIWLVTYCHNCLEMPWIYFHPFSVLLICMSVMESRSNSLPNPKAKPIASEVPQPPVDFNETFLEPVTDRNVDFAKGKSNDRNHKIRSFILHNLFLIWILFKDICSIFHFYYFSSLQSEMGLMP